MNKHLFVLAFLSFAMGANAQDWSVPYKFEIFDVLALYADPTNDTLYVGGEFNKIDGQKMGGIVAFDGSQFSKLGLGPSCSNVWCEGQSTIIRYKNDLYTSNVQAVIGGVDTIRGLARWDGQQWSGSAGKLTDCDFSTWNNGTYVQKALVNNGKLYVAGYFQCINEDTIRGVASWDGATWDNLGLDLDYNGALGFTSAPLMNSIEIYKNRLYAVGKSLQTENGINANHIFRYDTFGVNKGWHAVGGGLHGGSVSALDLAVYKGELYFSGYFTKAQGNAGNSIMRWDGIQWKEVGGGICEGTFGRIDALFVFDDLLYAVGYFDCVGGIQASNIATWDGEKWCSFGTSKFDNTIISAAWYKNEFYIGGGWESINGQLGPSFAKFVGDPANNICGTVATKPEATKPETLQLSPNPATEALRLTLPVGFENGQLTVFNPLGQPVFQQKLENLPEPALVIDIGELVSGAYFVQIRAGDGRAIGAGFIKP